jgi:hypothetical protein
MLNSLDRLSEVLEFLFQIYQDSLFLKKEYTIILNNVESKTKSRPY